MAFFTIQIKLEKQILLGRQPKTAVQTLIETNYLTNLYSKSKMNFSLTSAKTQSQRKRTAPVPTNSFQNKTFYRLYSSSLGRELYGK